MMKTRTILCTATLATLLLPGFAGEKQPSDSESPEGINLTMDYALSETFSTEELRALSEKPQRSRAENRRLMLLLLRACIEKDHRFQDLLNRPARREPTNVDLALSAYDYMLNGKHSSLDRILAELATEDIGADSDTIVVLSVIDEWDRTIKAFRKHFIHTDGAGTTAMVKFKATRAHLYPEKYRALRGVLEAPVRFGEPLLPGSE